MEKGHYYVGKAQNEHGLYKRAVLIFFYEIEKKTITAFPYAFKRRLDGKYVVIRVEKDGLSSR